MVFRRQALPAIAVGHIIIASVMVANGIIGARLHVPFPVLNRSSFGFWFSYFSVVSRVILSMFWFGVQTFTGSECIYQVSIKRAFALDPKPHPTPDARDRCLKRFGLLLLTFRITFLRARI